MNAEIICVASDSLSDEQINSASSYISKKLFELGHRTTYQTVSSPLSEEVRRHVSQGLDRSNILIIVGGIDSDTNAVAKNAVAIVTGIPLVTSDISLKYINEYCKENGIEPDARLLSAAITLKNSQIFKNELGLSLGIAAEYNSKKILLLPSDKDQLVRMFERYVAPVLDTNNVISQSNETEKTVQCEVVELLIDKNLTVSTAESCTGGMVSELLTEVPNSSKVFEYGISAYSNRIKTEVLSVPQFLINVHSAISKEVAVSMAENVRKISGSDLGIGITGNAGPAASEGKPVGLVFVALADKKDHWVEELNLSDSMSRDEIRHFAAIKALDMIKQYAAAFSSDTTEESINTEEAWTDFEESSDTSVADNQNDFAFIYDRTFDEEEISDINDETERDYEFVRKRFSLPPAVSEFFLKFSKSLRPKNTGKTKKLAIKVCFFVSLLCLIVSSSVLIYHFVSDNQQRNIIADAQSTWSFTEETGEDEVYTAFDPFKDNEDIRGWLTIPGTDVNHPVYQTTDNDYYLNHNMNKEPSRYGAIFFDYRSSVTKESPSQNVTIYGHNMKDGSMFGTLKRYKNLNFYKQNPMFTLTKLKEQNTYKIFSVMIMNATAADDNGYLYNFTMPTFSSQQEFLSWIAEARERSLINTTVDVIENDQIVTLVTCVNDFDNARLVIMARKLRANEEPLVSVADAELNPNPRYPQAWYDSKNLSGYTSSKELTDTSSSTEDQSSADPSASQEAVSSDIASSSQGSVPTQTTPSQTSSVTTSSTVQTSSAEQTSSAPTVESSEQSSTTEPSSSQEVTSSEQTESTESNSNA